MDVFFEKTRDICSRQCHGADWNSSEQQQGRRSAWILLLSLPFTLVHHISSIVAYGLHRGVQCVRRQSEPEASVRFSLFWGTHLANMLLALTWMTKSRMAMTYSVATFVFQQRVYSSLLFRRNWKGFVSSLLLGGLLVATPVAAAGMVATRRQKSHRQKATGEDDESVESNVPIELQEVTHIPSMDEQPDDTYRASNTSFCREMAGEEEDEKDDSSRFSQRDRITVSNAQSKTEPSEHDGRCDPENLWNDWDDGLKQVCIKFGSLVGDEEVKSRNLDISDYEQESAARPVSTAAWSEYEYEPEGDYESILEDDDYSDSTEGSMSKPKTIAVAHGRSGVSQLAPPALSPPTPKKAEEKPEDDSRRSLSQRMLKYLPPAIRPNTYNTDDSSETMEPNDVYIQVGGNKFTQIESHSGTVAWRKAIQETTRKFHKSPSFGDAHFRYVMKLLEGPDRDWYMGSMEYGWMKLNATQIRARCKDAYKKQLETDEEISTIYSEISKASLTKEQPAKGTPVGMIPFLVNDDGMAADRSIKTSATDKNMPRIEVEYHGENEVEYKKKRRGIIGRLIKPKHPKGAKETLIQPNKSEMAATPKKQRKLLVYLGKKDNHGYHQFLKSLRTVTVETQQSKDATKDDYTVFMHKSVIAKTRATQYLIKNASGIFEPAGEGQVFDFAWQQYHASRNSPATTTTANMDTRNDKEAVKPRKSGPLKKMLAVRALSSMTGDYKLNKKRTEQTIEVKRQEIPSTKEEGQDATPADDEQSITHEILEDIKASETAETTIADRGLISDDEFVQSIADKLSKDETDLAPSQQQPQRSRSTKPHAESEVAEIDRLTGRTPSRLLGSMALGRMVSKGRPKQNQQQQRTDPIAEEEIDFREPSGIRLQRLVEETNAKQALLDEGEVAAALREDPPVEDLPADSSPHEAPKGLKRILSLGRPRASVDKLSGMIEPLKDEESRKDPEQVKAWMAKNRTKSKFLRGLWAKVALKRRRRGEEVDSRHLRNSTIPQYAISPSSVDPSNDKNDKPTFYDELMEVLALEYRRATGQRDSLPRAIDEDRDSYSEDDILNFAGDRSRGTSFGDDEQSEYHHGDSSTITSYEDEVGEIPPQTLLQFVERKIEDEVLYSNTCLGMDLCADFQHTLLGPVVVTIDDGV